jgi:hypothetical protein
MAINIATPPDKKQKRMKNKIALIRSCVAFASFVALFVFTDETVRRSAAASVIGSSAYDEFSFSENIFRLSRKDPASSLPT